MHNHGNYIVSLGDVVRWLGQQAEALGVEIYPGFAAAEVLEEDGRVVGVATGDMGITKEGEPGANHRPAWSCAPPTRCSPRAAAGSLTKQLMTRFNLRDGRDPQTYALGIKELWEIPAAQHQPGLIEHTIGWPLDRGTYGGSWLYHFGDNLVSYGFVVGLDYKNPWLSPFDEMQRFKTHPAMRKHFEGGRRISYGARALSEGGLQSIPKLTFPGGALIGDAAGFLNVPKIKGTHAAMKSGMLAAEALAEALAGDRPAEPEASRRVPGELAAGGAARRAQHPARLRQVRPVRRHRLLRARHLRVPRQGALDVPPPARRQRDADAGAQAPKIAYPKPDGMLTFDKLSSVFISNTNHEENQPVHLRLQDPASGRA